MFSFYEVFVVTLLFPHIGILCFYLCKNYLTEFFLTIMITPRLDQTNEPTIQICILGNILINEN